MGDEQRQQPRIQRPFMVRYRRAEGGSWDATALRDVSLGGVRFLTKGAFEPDALLELQLLLPMIKEPVPVQGRVSWSKPGPMDLVEHGVRFEPLTPEAQAALQIAVDAFLKRGETSS